MLLIITFHIKKNYMSQRSEKQLNLEYLLNIKDIIKYYVEISEWKINSNYK